MKSPWAMFTRRITPYVMERPIANNAYSPLTKQQISAAYFGLEEAKS